MKNKLYEKLDKIIIDFNIEMKLLNNKKGNEIKKFRTLFKLISDHFPNTVCCIETHGNSFQVKYCSDKLKEAQCEVSDILTVWFSKKRNYSKVCFLQAKDSYKDKENINLYQNIFSFSGNTKQLILLRDKSNISYVENISNDFSKKIINLLNESLYYSFTAYGVFYDNNKFFFTVPQRIISNSELLNKITGSESKFNSSISPPQKIPICDVIKFLGYNFTNYEELLFTTNLKEYLYNLITGKIGECSRNDYKKEYLNIVKIVIDKSIEKKLENIYSKDNEIIKKINEYIGNGEQDKIELEGNFKQIILINGDDLEL